MHKESGIKIMLRLLKMVTPLAPTMLTCITLGIIGNLDAILIMVFGGMVVVSALGIELFLPMKALIVLTLVAALLRGPLGYLEQLKGHDVAFRLLALIRQKIFHALSRLAPAKLVDKRSGDIITTIMGDVEYVEVFFAHTIAPVSIGIVVPLSVLIFIGTFWYGFSLILLVFYLGILIPVYIARYVRNVGRRYRTGFADINTHLLDSLLGLRELILYGRAKVRQQEIRQKGQELTDALHKLRRYEGFVMALSEFFILSGTITILFAALYRLQQGYIGIDGLIIVTVTAASSFGPLVALSALSNDLMQTFAAAERIFALFDEQPLVIERPDATAKELHDDIDIQYDSINFSYPKTDEAVCNDLNIGVRPNSKTAIVGQSGSGKSTILRLLLRFWDINQGAISLNGEDIRRMPLKQVRSNMSMVSQDTYLFNETIEENIKIGNPGATDDEVETAAKRANIHDFIMTLPHGYQTKVGEFGGKLSAGERQRIAIARALIHDAPIILLDEPTSNLDTLNEGSILKTLAKEFKDKTIITVSHRPSTIVGSENILVLDEGRIVEQGTFQQLMEQKGTFRHLLQHGHPTAPL